MGGSYALRNPEQMLIAEQALEKELRKRVAAPIQPVGTPNNILLLREK